MSTRPGLARRRPHTRQLYSLCSGPRSAGSLATAQARAGERSLAAAEARVPGRRPASTPPAPAESKAEKMSAKRRLLFGFHVSSEPIAGPRREQGRQHRALSPPAAHPTPQLTPSLYGPTYPGQPQGGHGWIIQIERAAAGRGVGGGLGGGTKGIKTMCSASPSPV